MIGYESLNARPSAAPRPEKHQHAHDKQPPGEPRQLLEWNLGFSGHQTKVIKRHDFVHLQLSELLREIDVGPACETGFAQALEHLRHVLFALPPHQASDADIKGFAAASGYNMHSRTLPFAAPVDIYLMGSYATKTAVLQNRVADVAIEMPASCFERKDHLNHRYFAKRALYLMAIAAELTKHPEYTHQQWQCFRNDPRRPCLLIHFTHAENHPSVLLRLLPVCSPSMLRMHQLGPCSNSVRSILLPSMLKMPAQPITAKGAPATAAAAAAAPATAAVETAPTPHYNSSLVQDAISARHAALVTHAIAALPRLREALLLLRCWTRQQGFADQPDGITGFHLAMLAVHLQQRGNLSGAMSVLQLVRAVLLALADPKTFARGCFMHLQPTAANGSATSSNGHPHPQTAGSDSEIDTESSDDEGKGSLAGSHEELHSRHQEPLPPPPAAADFNNSFDVVFVDPTGWLNLTAAVRRSSLLQAQRCAKLTVAILDGTDGGLEAAFLTRHQPPAAFDYLYRLTLSSSLDAELTTSDAPAWRAIEAEAERIAKRALGTRALSVRILPRAAKPVSPRKGIATACTDELLLGVQVQGSEASRVVDMGPDAEDTAAAADFRAFWGDKAELRRFPDGRISEAVVWNDTPIGERHLILDELLSYALRRHLPVGTHVQGFAGSLDGALATNAIDLSDQLAAFRQLDAAAAALTKQLRALPDQLVLKVVSVQPLSPALRRTHPSPPQPHPLAAASVSLDAASGPLPRCLEPQELLVHLESSGKWPSDETAFLKAKAALGCQLAQVLSASTGVFASASEMCVDVLTSGFAFRLLLWSSRDEAMAVQNSAAGSALPTTPFAEAISPAVLAAHHGLVAAVAATSPAYTAVAALAARWLAGHMFSGMLAHQQVGELLAAAVWQGPSTLPAPASRVAGFHRVLALIAEHPWTVRPLVVDPAATLSPPQKRSAVQAYDAATAAGQAPLMWIAAPYTITAGIVPPWVKPTLDRAALQRLTACAAASLASLQRCAEVGEAAEGDPEDVSLSVFKTPLAHFDALLTLRPDALPQADHSLLPQPEAAVPGFVHLGGHDAFRTAPHRCARALLRHIPADVVSTRSPTKLQRELLVGFDPVALYCATLERQFGHLVSLYWDGCGGRVVAIKWRSSTLQPAPFDPALAYCTKPMLRPRSAKSAGPAEAPAVTASAAADGNTAGVHEMTTNGRSPAVKCKHPQSDGMVVPDLLAVLAQMAEIGQGLVAGVFAGAVTLAYEPSLKAAAAAS